MFLRTLVVLAATACNVSHSAPDPKRTSGAVSILAEMPAWDRVAVAGTLVVVDEDFLTISAVAASSGSAAWRATMQTEARGRQTLHANGTTVIAWLGDKRHVLEASSGKSLTVAPAPWNGTAWSDGGCGLDVEGGACAARCQCSFQVIDCLDGKPLGKWFKHQYIERIDHNHNRSAGCWGMGSSLLGRVGDVVLASVEDHDGKTRSPQVTVAIDVHTGKEVWRREHDTRFVAGATPDHATCWFSDLAGATYVADCARGATLWRIDPPPTTPRRLKPSLVGTDRLFVLSDTRATMHALRTGKPLWTVALPVGTLAWPSGVVPEFEPTSKPITGVAILDPSTGKPRIRVSVPNATSVVSDRAGGFYLVNDQLVHHDANGAVVGRTKIARDAGLQIGDELVLVRTTTESIFLERGDLRELGRIRGEVMTVSLEGTLGARRAALFRYDGKTVGQVTLVKIGP